MQILRGRTSAVDHLAISPDSRYVAAGGPTELHVWDLHDLDAEPTRHGVPTRRAESSSSNSFQFVSDGLLFNVNSGGWRLHDLASGRTVRWQGPANHRTRGAASPCGRFVVGEENAGDLCCWRISEDGLGLQRELIWSLPAERLFTAPEFAPDSEHFALFAFAINREPPLAWAVHRTSNGRPLARLEAGAGPVEYYSRGLFTPDGGKFLAGVRSHVYEWGVRAGGEGRLAARHPSGRHFRGLAVHPGGATLAATTNDTHMALYDLASGSLLRSYDWRIGRLNQVAFTPDGTRCVVAGASGKVLLFDVE